MDMNKMARPYLTGSIKMVKREIGYAKITESIIESYLKNLYKQKSSIASVTIKRLALKELWYMQEGFNKESFSTFEWILYNIDAPKKAVIKPKMYLSEKTLEDLIGKCRTKRQQLFIRFLSLTGLRISEMCAIKKTDIVFLDDGVKIAITTAKTKKKTHRMVEYKIIKEIYDFFNGNVYLFETGNGRAYNTDYISAQIKKIGKLIGLDISAHSLRHYWVRKRMESGYHPQETAELMGHKNSGSHIKFYTHHQ